ncbi:MAG: hypothetical protein K1X51_06400 [Rhodospirillaceae bacterium]|nr:hypothetical protein [Rhodospirillaceae bacterium]
MEKLIKILIVAFSEMRQAQRMTGRISTAAMLSVFAFFTTLGMLGCGVASLWLTLAPRVGNAEAALWSALLLFGLTLGLGTGSYLVIKNKDNGGGASTSSEFFDNIGGEIARAVSQSKGSVLLSALLAGMAYGSTRK